MSDSNRHLLTQTTLSIDHPNNGVSKGPRNGSNRPKKVKTKLVIGGLVCLVLLSALGGFLIGRADYRNSRFYEPPDPVDPLPPSPSWLHVFKRAAVCTDAPPCSDIGRHILSINGSAVDATLAAMFCNGLLNQQSMGLGGGFFMTVYIKEEEKAYTVIARETAPSAATQDMFHGNFDKSHHGPLSVGVPGELRGMWAAHQRWGKLPWPTLIKPTLEFCKYGYTISKAMYDGLSSAPYIKNDLHLSKTYVNEDGVFRKAGTIVKPSEDLCRTLERIALNGGDDLYNGSVARDLVKDLKEVGSIITAQDLRNYQPKITEPLVVPLRDGDTLFTPPPPSSGLILANILNILNGYNYTADNIKGINNTVLTYHQIIEAFKYAYSTRTRLGDADFLDLEELIRNVTDPEYGTETRLKINDKSTNNSAEYYGATLYNPPDSGTAHISVIGYNGDAVSMTSSINYYFGAGFSTSRTGIVMNNVMDDFSSPGITNYFGIKPSPANFIAPHKRPLSSMSPSIIVDRNGNAKLVIGASGGTKITTAVALVTMRKLWFGETIKEAVDAPRFHHQVFPMNVKYEYGITEDIVNGLRAKGHSMERYRDRGTIICALFRNKTAIYGNADFRKGGDVSGMD
ncbi:glutathione hydrolase 1 proenzyme-like isoform X2 [Leptidea sinapis]|uniref:glutathione hydrolase 1 proenzyme-like isoform X2 n=1 Tax=Leptidea sinapis TaxID=189913 RepID=UPI00212C2A48|nr:glutathione hydrolase 1 proenzyme-like isoform X2 [Leptidea sinapis]